MEENKNLELEGSVQEQEEKSAIDFQLIYTTIILNWKWFVLSLVVCLGLGYLYLRYARPQYQATTKVLIKDDQQNKTRGMNSSMIQSAANLGFMTNSNGIDNEIEILSAHDLAQEAVYDMKAYVSYYHKGTFKDPLVYKTQEINVDLDLKHLKKLNAPLKMSITKDGNKYQVKGKYYVPIDAFTCEKKPREFEKTLSGFPATINTRIGNLNLTANDRLLKKMKDGDVLKAVVVSPEMAANAYVKSLTVSQTSKTTTIAELVLNNEDPQRALDYLNTLTKVYNRQANEDKNEIAYRTEQFINNRLEKINTELGSTEGQLENYKKRNRVVELKINATASVKNADEFAQKLNEANTQVELIKELGNYMNEPGNKYQPIPSNVGLTDESSTSLINEYNKIALERNKLLHSASETSPTVTPLTAQLEDLTTSIKRAMRQAKLGMEIQRNNIAQQAAEYAGQIGNSPEQERVLTQIGRQQEVKSGLYLMLLEKREENSISLAATADKGKVIDAPSLVGKVSPKGSIIMLIALVLGIAIPAGILFLIEFFKYKIEGHEDVMKLTTIPIISDIPVASDVAKGRADIVVHQNVNNLMEEIFRGLRTNIQFMLKDQQKVLMFTSSTSGEGKTFVASNVAISLALLGKKVIVVGLDIRKPRLAELFEIDNHHTGITNLIVHEHNTWEDIQKQILPSEVNDHLDLLMAGPVPPNPGELVTRQSLDDIIDQLKQHYDYVVIDTAPVGLVNDSLQLGRLADLCVFVCRADYTPKASFGMINGLNAEKKLPNMCLVLNGVDLSKKKHSFYYGVGKYGKYGKYGNYGSYGAYGKYGKYGKYGTYGQYGSYGNYSNSHYGNANDNSIKK